MWCIMGTCDSWHWELPHFFKGYWHSLTGLCKATVKEFYPSQDIQCLPPAVPFLVNCSTLLAQHLTGSLGLWLKAVEAVEQTILLGKAYLFAVPSLDPCFHNRFYSQAAACIHTLAPGKFIWNFRYVIFKRILVIDGWGISCEIALIWMSLDFTDEVMISQHWFR